MAEASIAEDDAEAIKSAICDTVVESLKYVRNPCAAIVYSLAKAFAVVNEKPFGPACIDEPDARKIKAVLNADAVAQVDRGQKPMLDLPAVATDLIAAYSFVDVFTRSDSSEALAAFRGLVPSELAPETRLLVAEVVGREGLRFAQQVADAAWARAEALRAAVLDRAGSAGQTPTSPPVDSAAPTDEPAVRLPVPGASL